MRNKIKLFSLILIVVFIFSFTACTIPKTATETTIAQTAVTETMPPETTTAETTTVETTAPETTIPETTAETTVNNDMELFRNAIEDYEMLSKGLDYATEVYNIAFDEKLTDEGFGNRYMDLANKVGEDYFGFPLFKDSMLEKAGIKNPTPEMKRILDLIDQWSDKTETIYSYTAKYYYGEGGEFKIKADEL
jgi:hypothetical protein